MGAMQFPQCDAMSGVLFGLPSGHGVQLQAPPLSVQRSAAAGSATSRQFMMIS
jgi:hypothetical protein